jgi:hypothetical protein
MEKYLQKSLLLFLSPGSSGILCFFLLKSKDIADHGTMIAKKTFVACFEFKKNDWVCKGIFFKSTTFVIE